MQLALFSSRCPIERNDSRLQRDRLRYSKFLLDVPRGVNMSWAREEFCDEWERRTGTLVKEVDSERGLMTVVAKQEHDQFGLSLVEHFLEIAAHQDGMLEEKSWNTR